MPGNTGHLRRPLSLLSGLLSHRLPAYAGPLACLFFTFLLAAGLRLLELPFWDSPAYKIGDEYLLATHDAYHWIAGAEDFEFGAGHPMTIPARIAAALFGTTPAVAGFWLPPFFSGLLASAIFLWGWAMRQPYAGMCAGVLASLAPAFCARTLLGFYDTDLVILLFAVLLGLVPALWLMPRTMSLPEAWRSFRHKKQPPQPSAAGSADQSTGSAFRSDAAGAFALLHTDEPAASAGRTATLLSGSLGENAATSVRLFLLAASGLFGWWMQEWHSLFPYLVRFSALAVPALVLVLGRAEHKKIMLRDGLCHALPLLLGPIGAAGALAYAAVFLSTEKKRAYAVVTHPLVLAALWGVVLFFCLDSTVIDALRRSFAAYTDRSGDMATLLPSEADPVIFPSVAQSIIEVQTISLRELLIYCYPIEAVTVLGLVFFVRRLILTPAAFIWFLPLLALAALSLRMGARMTMFAPPGIMLALCLEVGAVLSAGLHHRQWLRLRKKARVRPVSDEQDAADESGASAAPVSSPQPPEAGPLLREAHRMLRLRAPLRLAVGLALTVGLSWPLVSLLPDYTQGPILSKEQAQALSFIRKHSPEDAFVWNWWDWGYAAHHFSHRYTIADGARHGGPSLYLPAAVYATSNPRFARQLIKHTALAGNVPGQVFAGLSAAEAQKLMQDLGSADTPLLDAPGKQYLVVSFDLVRLGLWVTRYGSWDFETKEGPGALMSNLTPALQLNLETGVIFAEGQEPIYAASIAVFNDKGVEQEVYNRYGAYHFFFNTRRATGGNSAGGIAARFWKAVRGNYTARSLPNDKIVMDQAFYNSMMVQLLLRPKNDPKISPYFRLVFDNSFARVYEVL